MIIEDKNINIIEFIFECIERDRILNYVEKEYKIELGYELINEIMFNYRFKFNSETKLKELDGIEVVTNYKEPYIFKLFKCVL